MATTTEPEGDIAPNLIAYRLGQLELLLKDMRQEVKNLASKHIDREALDLHLNPLRDRVTELEAAKVEREHTEANRDWQVKLAVSMAVASPIITLGAYALFTQ